MSYQIGAKKEDFKPKESGTVAPCHAEWPCHSKEWGNASQGRGTVWPCRVARPCHISFPRIVAIWRCNWHSCFSLFFSLLKTAILRFLGFIFRCYWIQGLRSNLVYAFSRLSLQIIQSILFYLFFYVLIQVSYFLVCLCSWLRLRLEWCVVAKFLNLGLGVAPMMWFGLLS